MALSGGFIDKLHAALGVRYKLFFNVRGVLVGECSTG